MQWVTQHPQSAMLGLRSLSLVYSVLDPSPWTGVTHSHGGSSLTDMPRELSVSRELIGLFGNKMCRIFKKHISGQLFE